MAVPLGKLVRVMVVLYVLMLLVLSALSAAVEHPRRHNRSNYNPLRVTIRPKIVTFYPGESVSVRCKARGGVRVEDYPFISFYRQWDETETPNERVVFPVSSSYPGVLLTSHASPSSSNKRRGKAIYVLTMGPDAYDTLLPGNNFFYCRASTYRGDSKQTHFIIRKMLSWE